jgi:hypothetical protein
LLLRGRAGRWPCGLLCLLWGVAPARKTSTPNNNEQKEQRKNEIETRPNNMRENAK